MGLCPTSAQDVKTMRTALADYLDNYNKNATCYTSLDKVRVEDITVSPEDQTVYIYLNEGFLGQPFTPESVSSIQENIKQRLPKNLQDYHLVVYADGTPIEMLIPVNLTDGKDTSRVYGKKEYKGHPWVQREELPYDITQGLQGRHLCLWASHGKYYNNRALQEGSASGDTARCLGHPLEAQDADGQGGQEVEVEPRRARRRRKRILQRRKV